MAAREIFGDLTMQHSQNGRVFGSSDRETEFPSR
jgi:hypothetical protein